MSRPLFFVWRVLLAAALLCYPQAALAKSAGSQFQVVAAPPPRVEAPADEYFGRYRLSSLSVRTAISDMTIEGNSPLALPLQIERIEAVQSALPDWAQAYPHDPWLPSAMFKFAQFLIAKGVPSLYPSALAFLSYLVTVYPNTWYATHAQAAIADLDMFPDIDQLSGPTVGQLANVRDHDFATLTVRRHH